MRMILTVFILTLFSFITLRLIIPNWITKETSWTSTPNKRITSGTALILPEDAFEFSPAKWQTKFGCDNNNMQYVGYSGHLSPDVSILKVSGKDKVYQLGDLVTNEQGSNYRIIWIDHDRTILSDAREIIVKCKIVPKEETSKKIKNEKKNSDERTKKIESSIIKSTLGSITKVDSSEAHGGGYKLNECYKYCWLLKRLNIERGDVIKAIDGKNVISFDEEKLKEYITNKRTDIKVTIERNGKEEVIDIAYKTFWPIVRLMH